MAAMPIHDWTRVTAGTFHTLHHGWIWELHQSLNGGILPQGFYALPEQVAGNTVPDVLTLERVTGGDMGDTLSGWEPDKNDDAEGGVVTMAVAPPRMKTVQHVSEAQMLLTKQKQVAIRHISEDRVVALVEIVSPGNKSGRRPLRAIVEKTAAAVDQGCHVLLVDLFPPGRLDPNGLHDLVWQEVGGEGYEPPADRPLTLASYRAAEGATAYVEPTAVGQELADMPLFLDPGRYVNVPLAATYAAAFAAIPRHLRRALET